MRVFFGAAIQGLQQRGERSSVYRMLLSTIKNLGHTVVSEHTATNNMAETATALEVSIGPLPPAGPKRMIYVRDKMIEGIESELGAAIFEVSTPSLGTGIEIAHAYLRPRMGLRAIPILNLYEKDYWPHNLSTMIRGITHEAVADFHVKEYSTLSEAADHVRNFLISLR